MNVNSDQICKRCKSDKNRIKLFSPENNMDPQKLPTELSGLTIIEQQLICRISPRMNVHMLKHGGIASSGHCVTFPQDVNEPANNFPRLPNEINLIKVRRIGKMKHQKITLFVVLTFKMHYFFLSKLTLHIVILLSVKKG